MVGPRLEPECLGTAHHFLHTDFGAEMMAHVLGIGCNAVEPQEKAATRTPPEEHTGCYKHTLPRSLCSSS